MIPRLRRLVLRDSPSPRERCLFGLIDADNGNDLIPFTVVESGG